MWYVAIDFQLFALAVLLLWLPHRLAARFPAWPRLLRASAAWRSSPGMTVAPAVRLQPQRLVGRDRPVFLRRLRARHPVQLGPAPAARHAVAGLCWRPVAVAALAVGLPRAHRGGHRVMLFLAVTGRSGLLHALPLPAVG